MLRYPTGAQLVMAARSKAPDALDPSKTLAVPLTWQTDGSHAWPGALAYYAEHHDQAPPADYLDRLRAANFQLPPADPQAVERAALVIRSQPAG